MGMDVQYRAEKEKNEILLNKLQEIKSYCEKTLEMMNCDSGINAYACGRCIEAENVLSIIGNVKNDKKRNR